ncbi:MAG: hypothetical protein AVDCRST_MAG36-2836 [uncultured Nocardioidaceae bacterium]|uniref:Uncharacterized protein n=1 Tax=uncultured Nocardioidaceae bacterium TaxID=253824 RepID=A0A6J4MSN4_9ACTN|nr:MAG: hypothetical protein AVDCRST_MAG36-2836 [uncultured Nocardioidaceae bacterium]
MSGVLLAVDAEDVSAGPLGLLVVVLMIIATVFLIRNMNARLRRLPREFPDQRAAGRPGAPDGPADEPGRDRD